MAPTSKVAASRACYIKLGKEGGWESQCLKEGILKARYSGVPHGLALQHGRAAIRQIYLDKGLDAGTATKHANQLCEFYSAAPDTLWITFANGYLYWAFAQPEVTYLEKDSTISGASRSRQTVDGWHNCSLAGKPLTLDTLHGSLTSTAGYRQTICEIKPTELDYLLRQINDEELPMIAQARQARDEFLQHIELLIQRLRWNDLEVLVDMLFAHSGWRRLGEMGGTLKTLDLILEERVTGAKALVQVKSKTRQSELDGYVAQFRQRPETRMFYIYHSSSHQLRVTEGNVELIGVEQLAGMVFRTGLFDWILAKTS